jgi:hypothetical protein
LGTFLCGTTDGRTAAVPADEGGSLGGDDMVLQAILQGFALADRQANGFQSMVALLETQDLAVGEHGAIVADDPKLKVNVHGRRHAGVFQKLQGIQPPNYPPSPKLPTIAVGNAIAGIPPHRSERAPFGHSAPTSGV